MAGDPQVTCHCFLVLKILVQPLKQPQTSEAVTPGLLVDVAVLFKLSRLEKGDFAGFAGKVVVTC